MLIWSDALSGWLSLAILVASWPQSGGGGGVRGACRGTFIRYLHIPESTPPIICCFYGNRSGEACVFSKVVELVGCCLIWILCSSAGRLCGTWTEVADSICCHSGTVLNSCLVPLSCRWVKSVAISRPLLQVLSTLAPSPIWPHFRPWHRLLHSGLRSCKALHRMPCGSHVLGWKSQVLCSFGFPENFLLENKKNEPEDASWAAMCGQVTQELKIIRRKKKVS